MTFDSAELERYARHIVLRDVGGPGQQKLKAARVLVIGTGGLGAPIVMYLAAAGVGTIGLVDDDVVSLSNLQRQVIHGTPDVGRPKVESGRDAVARLNPHVTIEAHQTRFVAENARALVEAYDVVVDGSDNFATRFLAADTCFAVGRTLVTAAVSEFDGSITTLAPHLPGPDGTPNPSYRCLFPEPPPRGLVPACAEAGILGAVVGVLGTLAATEVLKLITGVGEPLYRRLLMVDLRSMRFETIDYRRNPATVRPSLD
ncbi:MAG: molybdopterin-synthase adenylyltransferase MoeB [Siculibacillus sp.]|nr:molybdopterin-synthase adenylyltransferase MoeB [Siculibacillus sp.]